MSVQYGLAIGAVLVLFGYLAANALFRRRF